MLRGCVPNASAIVEARTLEDLAGACVYCPGDFEREPLARGVSRTLSGRQMPRADPGRRYASAKAGGTWLDGVILARVPEMPGSARTSRARLILSRVRWVEGADGADSCGGEQPT